MQQQVEEKQKSVKNPIRPLGLPSSKSGVSSFLNRRAGFSQFADRAQELERSGDKDKPQDVNSVEAIQYRKDMAAANAAGMPYSTWVKKSREDLSTLTWPERMKKPYDPNQRDFTDNSGAR